MDWKKESDVVQEIDFKNSDQSKGNFYTRTGLKIYLHKKRFIYLLGLSQNVMRLPPKVLPALVLVVQL